MIHACCWRPKASCQAGSRLWKKSSGWKKVRRVRALTMRRARSAAKTSAASVVARWELLAGIEQSKGFATGGEHWCRCRATMEKAEARHGLEHDRPALAAGRSRTGQEHQRQGARCEATHWAASAAAAARSGQVRSLR